MTPTVSRAEMSVANIAMAVTGDVRKLLILRRPRPLHGVNRSVGQAFIQ
jgi:hypothetical protein